MSSQPLMRRSTGTHGHRPQVLWDETNGPARMNIVKQGVFLSPKIHTGNKAQGQADHSYSNFRVISDVEDFVEEYLGQHRIEIFFDDSVKYIGALEKAETPLDVKAYLLAEKLDLKILLDSMMLEQRARKLKLAKADVQRALAHARDKRRQERVLRLFSSVGGRNPYFSEFKQSQVDADWLRLAQALFEPNAELVAACLKHFVWQVKRKILGRSVDRPLMPVIFSPEQGTGKTTFVRKFLSPLCELVALSSFSQYADQRSLELYRFPVLFMDDADGGDKKQVPEVKSLMTADRVFRRVLGTSLTAATQQLSSLIGTTNYPIETVIADETGHRRFVSLRFRNGKVEAGGTAEVWQAVRDMDPVALWRSVNEFEDSPLAERLSELYAHQKQFGTPDVVLEWLLHLDMDSDDIRFMHGKHGVPAEQLWKLFCQQTGESLSNTAFASRMKQHVSNPATPFAEKIKAGAKRNTFYPVRSRNHGPV